MWLTQCTPLDRTHVTLPNVCATVASGWSRSGSSAAPLHSAAPTTHDCGVIGRPLAIAAMDTPPQAIKPLIAWVGPVDTAPPCFKIGSAGEAGYTAIGLTGRRHGR